MKAQRKLLGIALAGILGGALAAVQSTNATLAAGPDGAAIYASKCASCHKADGKGGGPFPALAGNKNVNASDPGAIVTETVKGKGLMPAYSGKLSNAEIAAVLTYVRSNWGNKASAVTEAQVAAVK